MTAGGRQRSTRIGRWFQGKSGVAAPVVVAILTVVAAVLRMRYSGTVSLRLDEAQSIQFASYPLSAPSGSAVPDLFRATAADVQPPGYLLLLHGWMALFGTDLNVLRLPSEIAATLCVPALYLLASAIYGRRVGVIAAVLGTVAPFWLWHAQEVRMYSFLLLFTIVSSYGLVVAMERRRWWGWPLLVLGTVLAMYTHYFAFLTLASQLLFVLLHVRRYWWRRAVLYALALAVSAALYLPWLLALMQSFRGASDPALHAPTIYTPLVVLSEFVLGYLSTPVTSDVIAAWPGLVLAALALSAFARPSFNGRYLWMLFLVPLIVSLVVSVTLRPFLSERYLIICTPALFVLIAVALERLSHVRAKAWSIIALVATLLAAGGFQRSAAANPAAENYRDVITYIESHAQAGDAVGLDSAFNQYPYLYYANDNLPTYDLPFAPPADGEQRPALNEASLAAYLKGIEAGRTRLWVIYYLETNEDPAGLVRHYLDYHTASHQVIFGADAQRNITGNPESFVNVQLVLYTLIPTPAAPLQDRPLTTAQLRQLTQGSPSLRQPYAPPTGAAGLAAPLLGGTLPPTDPARQWTFDSLAASVTDVRLNLFNPSLQAITVELATGDGLPVQQVVVGPHSNLDVHLIAPDGPQRSSLSVTSIVPFVPSRLVSVRGQLTLQDGHPHDPPPRAPNNRW